MKTRTEVNGVTLAVTEFGNPSSLPVVFLHGFPFSHRMWKGQLEEVGKEMRTIAYDLRGHGESTVGDGQYTIEGHVDDLIAVLDHLHLTRIVLVGLSMGGYITLRALERHPERIRAAVLCDTRSEADTNEGKIGRAAAIKLVKAKGSAAFASDFVKKVFAPETLRSNHGAVDLIAGIIERTPPLSIAGTLLALAARTDTTDGLQRISVPVLILVGEHDVLTPPAASLAMHRRIPGSEVFIVPGAGHMSPLENAEYFNEKLLAFLRRL
jgi:pimeloyl-ACP methyl ester carboxylesterase